MIRSQSISMQIPVSSDWTPFISPSSTCSSVLDSCPDYQRVTISGDYCAGVRILNRKYEICASLLQNIMPCWVAVVYSSSDLTSSQCTECWRHETLQSYQNVTHKRTVLGLRPGMCVHFPPRSQWRITNRQPRVCSRLCSFGRSTQSWPISDSAEQRPSSSAMLRT